MGTSGDVADQVVNMSLNGLEKGINITGKGAERVLALLLVTLKDNRTNGRGKLKLKNMLKSNKQLDIFTIKQKDLKKFAKRAKEYGLPFTVLCPKVKKDSDDVVDLLVRTEDAPKVNRIIDRFKLSVQDKGEIKLTPQKELESNINENGKEQRDEVTEDFINSMLRKTPSKDQPPSQLFESEKNFLSDNSLLNNNMNSNMESMKNMTNMANFDKEKKKSVKGELAMIKEEQKIKSQENSVKERITDNFVNELLKNKERGKE